MSKFLSQTKNETIAAVPRLYAVIIHNDDYTPMDFVVFVLTKVFNKNAEDAEKIMMDVHKAGSGIAGVYTFDIAATKKDAAERLAQQGGYPLLFTLSDEGAYT